MVLQDHFHPPLSLRRHWHAFLNAWATYLSSDLNRLLPEGYFAEANVQFGIEIDIAAFEEAEHPRERPGSTAVWTAPPPALTVPIALQEETVEVLLFRQEGGPLLAGAIELVSPANKDRPAHRDAFVSKCAAYVQQGVGLVIVDVVTDRRASLHDELIARLGAPAPRSAEALYAAAYRPTREGADAALQVWHEVLKVGQALPTVPLWLVGGVCVPVDLAATYQRTCREQRLAM